MRSTAAGASPSRPTPSVTGAKLCGPRPGFLLDASLGRARMPHGPSDFVPPAVPPSLRKKRTPMLRRLAVLVCALLTLAPVARAGEPPLRIATFQVDVTPPLGTPLCD